MGKPDFIAFAGIDEETDLDMALNLSCKYPIEWGFLASTSRAGKEKRYPDFGFIRTLEQYKQEGHPAFSLAIHLCGELARKFNRGELVPYLRIFDRIQVNLPADEYNEDVLVDMAWKLDKQVITQVRTPEFPEPSFYRRAFLYDVSGGNGVTPAILPSGLNGHSVYGYAGGITPDNVVAYNEKVNSKHYYLDMESGIRTDDWLDIDKCAVICRAIYGDR